MHKLINGKNGWPLKFYIWPQINVWLVMLITNLASVISNADSTTVLCANVCVFYANTVQEEEMFDMIGKGNLL